ncbi:MAG: alpha-E domain-containing protein [Clostridia bacterium]|nr:alpha-E domain-containing protein [Clostridia bacterium]
MGIVSLTNTDKLYWLGRYSERVYTTIRLFGESFDHLIEGEVQSIGTFCASLNIPNIYTSGDDFVERYLFDAENPDSVLANLTRAYDNAMTLREEIGSECVSYIQLAIYAMNSLRGSENPMFGLQKVVDDILAFWGLTDDIIPDENVRNIIKVGKRVERLDLYARLRLPQKDILREVRRLAVRISRTNLQYAQADVERLMALAMAGETAYDEIVALVDGLVKI